MPDTVNGRPDHTMVQITKKGTVLSDSSEKLQKLRGQFEKQHYVPLPSFFAPDLLALVQAWMEKTGFYEKIHEDIGSNKELCMREDGLAGVLHFLMNGQVLFRVIQDITGCSPIGCFSGRVYRFTPRCGHHDAWHDDVCNHRLVGMSVNLSTHVYSGGVLQLRDCQTKQIIQEVPNTGVGDAVIFRLADYLQHRVTEVEGAHSKTAFAGWFRSQPSFLSLLKTNAQTA